MNDWLAVAPQATVARGVIGCMVSVGDTASRPPQPLMPGERLDIGSHCLESEPGEEETEVLGRLEPVTSRAPLTPSFPSIEDRSH